MAWTNPPLVVFHGTDLESAKAIAQQASGRPNGIDLSRCRPTLDFGHCFYVTTRLAQAIAWANRPHKRARFGRGPTRTLPPAAVLRFRVDRNALAEVQDLHFTDPDGGDDYFTFTRHCRAGGDPGSGRTGPYAVVAGPVLAWPDDVTIPRMDQIAFHSAALNLLTEPAIIGTGTPTIEAVP